MSSNFFFLQVNKNERNKSFLSNLENYANSSKQQVYVINKPLGDNKYSYDYLDGVVVLIPKHKFLFVNFGQPHDEFDNYVDEFIEDLGSMSDKFQYKKIIGRPKAWREKLIAKTSSAAMNKTEMLLTEYRIENSQDQKICELLISLLTGSINDVDRVKSDVPENLLDKIKQKIILFDGEQTRFLYQNIDKKEITIQGLSGTGKTELLLHKLKEIYTGVNNSKIMFTCFNKVLASDLKKRIPNFFNFMKVEQQIDWNSRLWCVHSWGSENNKDSGAYSYICSYYNITFRRYSWGMSFDTVCKLAINEISSYKLSLESQNKEFNYAFDYMLIDESQDFPESFFELCKIVTKNTIYIAGDIFQNIFDTKISTIEPDYLLSKCYRTDPRTLMFAHALGLGLFETKKINWLEDNDWQKCGYIVEKINSIYKLKREPLRRFEDLESENSMVLSKTININKDVIDIISDIKKNNPTVLPEDIGIIFLDGSKESYLQADELEQTIPREFGWEINKSYESKEKVNNKVFLSNINNVKGLEFPFVICITVAIRDTPRYRNALYTMLTRSFIKSYLLISSFDLKQLIPLLQKGLDKINNDGYMEVSKPSPEEIEKIKDNITKINFDNSYISYDDFIITMFDEENIESIYRDKLRTVIKETIGEVIDPGKVKKCIRMNYEMMLEA